LVRKTGEKPLRRLISHWPTGMEPATVKIKKLRN
jgi:hypothetical protein